MEETWIPLLVNRNTIDGVDVVLVVVGVEHREAVGIHLEGIDEVLCGLVEVPTLRPDAPAAVEHVAPVVAAELGVVVDIVGVLNCEDGFDVALVVLHEEVAEVGLVTELAAVGDVAGQFNNLLHILLVDVAVAVAGLVAVAISEGEVALGEHGSSCILVDASLIGWSFGHAVVSSLEVLDNLLHQLLVGELVITGLFLSCFLEDDFVNPGHLIPKLDQLEVEVSAEEAGFTHAHLGSFGTEFLFAELLDGEDGAVGTRNGYIETIPEFVHVVGLRSGKVGPNLDGVVVGVGSTRTALHGVVARKRTVGPEVEGIVVPVGTERGVCCGEHAFGIGECKFLVNGTRRLHLEEIIA